MRYRYPRGIDRFWNKDPCDKLPRRIKKFFIGKRIGKARLKRLIRSVIVAENKYPEEDTITPLEFCPKCGCVASYGGKENRANYPEEWRQYYCRRCHALVAYVDNSPYIHVLSEMLRNTPQTKEYLI